ncbi:hypothetical protein IFR04_015411 [Cadophora malorum]|uniref:Uncharacterized protein n=1 Tax=Cadophora malorum TaxID=108018 RepID=A0A8H7T1E6_9HELO|nr:hypothetical protein IFR04_015411 [Cadophora malorum]
MGAEMERTELQALCDTSNTTTTVLDQARHLIDEYRQDGSPQVPIERDPPLEAWECRALSTRAERQWYEENERHMTQQEWLDVLKGRLAQRIEEDDIYGDELEEENSRIRNLYHEWNFNETRPRNFSSHYTRARSDHNDHDPIIESKMEDEDDSEYQDVRDELGSDHSDDSDDSGSSDSTDNSDDMNDLNDSDSSDDSDNSVSSGTSDSSENSDDLEDDSDNSCSSDFVSVVFVVAVAPGIGKVIYHIWF